MIQNRHKPPKMLKPGKFELLKKEKNLRPVVIRHHNGKGYEDRNGYFHCWSCYTDEGGSTPIAIIEWLDGTCTDTLINDIKFTDR